MTPCLLQHQGYMCQLSSRNLKSYCKYSYSLPAAKLTVYPQSWALLSSPPLFNLQSPSSPICRLRITLHRLPGQRQMFLDFLHPRLLICPLAGSPYRQALSLTPHHLSSSANTTDSGVKFTYVSHSPLVYVKAISTKVPVVHPTIWVYISNP